MSHRVLTLAVLLSFLTLPASAAEYKGLCEASAGAFIDRTHFAVASDETNILQIYERGKPEPVGNVNMEKFTRFDKSDIEAAAIIGDRVYWISSHSFNKEGEDKTKRKVFFATKIVLDNGKPTLEGVGSPSGSLRDGLAATAKVSPEELNIEAMAATPKGELLLGFRSPLRNDKALVIPFTNPADAVDKGRTPEFGDAVLINLSGRGLRSMEWIGEEHGQYLVVAGPISDAAEGFALFRWSGPGSEPIEVKGVDLAGIKPEAAMVVPG